MENIVPNQKHHPPLKIRSQMCLFPWRSRYLSSRSEYHMGIETSPMYRSCNRFSTVFCNKIHSKLIAITLSRNVVLILHVKYDTAWQRSKNNVQYRMSVRNSSWTQISRNFSFVHNFCINNHRRTLCKISKRLNDWNRCYWGMRICEIWV